MSTVIIGIEEWARQQFGMCELGDKRRVARLVTLAEQVAARPDASTPDQTETWGDCKAAYRLFNETDVSFDAIIAPHCRHTRDDCRPGDVKLIINDTTELDFGIHRKVQGLKPTGNGYGRGFFLHSALMVDSASGYVEGMAGQTLFYREPKTAAEKAQAHNTRRKRKESPEGQVWRNLFQKVGRPAEGVKWIHVCDRGADDYEVYCQAQRLGCGFVVRASKLNRKVLADDGRKLALSELLSELPSQGTRQVKVLATKKSPARTATVELRFCTIQMPWPSVVTPWMRANSTGEPLRMNVVELREMSPPKGAQGVRWVLYTSEEAQWVVAADRVIEHYERRPIVEEYHKALKTGCQIEERQYRTAARLERVLGLLSVTAVRLVQIKTAALETPERPARELVPLSWIEMLQKVRRRPLDPHLTIDAFLRMLAGLGGHLGRKGDGRPGWITLWRGIEKLQLILRGANASRKKCG